MAQVEAQFQAEEQAQEKGVLLKQGTVRYGPYGSSSPQNFDWQLLHGERFIRVSIRHGWIVDAIGFRARRPDGGNRDVHFGGNGGNQSHIDLRPSEIVLGFSGKSAYSIGANQVVIAQIYVHTNERTLGPYGSATDVTNVTDFYSPIRVDRPLVGVFGRCGRYLESVGVILRLNN
ncbi:uncharacterized protein LOC130807266 [Amaranthus tricolor]|uniref:uncharacterized protein LOC130807266 n=1 Tax=Amaranthus tricolor TaxID=29722 RepID=UPI0025869A1D|nr:uncharacterized protein LOC130807266 [Amaranthus tricolor]